MTSLEDVYDGGVGGVTTRRRMFAGATLLASGTLLSLAGLTVITTGLGGGPQTISARLYAGVLFGLAAPGVLSGIVVALPAKPHLRIAAAIGASLTLLGVATFTYAYPEHWAGYGRQLTAQVSGVYALGILVLTYCLFAGIVTLRQRNDPGGTVSLTLRSPTVILGSESDDSESSNDGLGGVGFLGSTPDGSVDTQTGTRSHRSSSRRDSPAGATSDGGVARSDIHTPEPSSESHSRRSPSADVGDTYCGNCRYFKYRNGVSGMEPYCQYHGERLEDMEACEHWEANRRE